MDGSIRVSGGDAGTEDDYMDSSFWIDACEDLSCSTIDDFDFAKFGTVHSVSGLSPHSRTVDYGGVEHFIDTIGCVRENPTNGYFDFCQSFGSAVSENQHDTIKAAKFQDSTFIESILVEEPDTSLTVAEKPVKCKLENCFVFGDDQNSLNISRDVEFNSSIEIMNKRARLESQNRRQHDINSRKRVFEGDHDYRNIENKRIRMNHFSGRIGGRKDIPCKNGNTIEGKGYWQRDSTGKDLVFRCGSYKADCFNRRNSISEKTQVNDSDERNEPKENILVDKVRQYQLDVLEQAKAKNTIAFLETGAGKTLIAVLLIKSVSDRLLEEKKKMLAVFLVPKVPLVYQQAEVIREQTSFHVGHYCGDMGHNFWDARKWKQEFETKQVLVMTAQILLNILRHSIIKMESISIIILDECHHAVKKHPYSLVMSEFYHTVAKEKRPSIFGMTASPVNLKGVSSQVDCAIKIRNLESKLDSTVFTIKDRKELEQHVHMPSEVIIEYDKAASQFSLHKQIENIELEVVEAAKSSSRRSKWQFMGARDAGAKEELHRFYGVSARTEGDGAANLIQKLRAICYTLSELGQWCAYKMAQTFLSVLQNNQRANYQIDVMFQETYLKRVVCLLQCELSEGAVSEKNNRHTNAVNTTSDNVHSTDAREEGEHTTTDIEEGEIPDSCVDSGGEHVDSIIGAAVADGIVTPKVQSLIKLLLQYKHTKDFRAIIFVERVAAALVLPKVFSELPSLNFIRCASLIGHSNSLEMRTCKMQDTINKFRDARITTLVTTSVAEEGLDIRQCNVVIRFDLAKTVLAYVQSRGRARKPGSAYILMVEKGNVSHSEFLFNARNSEETIRKEATDRTDISHVKGISKLFSSDVTRGAFYQVESTGAMVSLNSAVGLIHLYCTQLPSDRFSILRPDFIMESHEMPGGSVHYSCKLHLPCNAAFDKLEGPVCASLRLAQQVVCLDACKKLHEMGALTDMLLPDKGNGDNEEKIDQEEPLLGSARHREFYPEGVASDLKGEWLLLSKDDCRSSELFHLYVYLIKCENIGSCKDKFFIDASDFAILFGQKLDPEVLSVSVDLFIARAMTTKATLEFRGSIDITFDQLTYLKSFHVRLMSIVLDVDVDPLNTPWDAAKAYLFVPLVKNHSPDPMKEVDWTLVNQVFTTDAWKSALHRARPDVYFGTKERALGGDRREYGFAKLRHGMIFGQSAHPTYGIRGAVAQFDVVKATGLVPVWDHDTDSAMGKLVLADCYCSVDELVGKIITAAHSGKRFFVDSVCLEMNAENSFPRKESYLGPLEYSSYSEYYRQKYGVELFYKQQPLIKARGVSYCKNLLSPRFQQCQGESEDTFDKIYYVFLPPELCVVHPLSAPLIRGAQRLPSIMKRVESMLLAIELKNIINYPIPALKILEALTAASCQEPFCYERAELLGDAYLKWVVSRFLFLNYPDKHEGQLTRMRQKMVSNVALYLFALRKGLQSYILADRFSPSRWAAPGVLPVFDEDAEAETFLFDDKEPTATDTLQENANACDGYEDIEAEEGEIEADSSSYRVLSSKTLADVVEALIGVYYVEGGKSAAKHLMEWLGFDIKFIPEEMTWCISRSVPEISESLLKSVDFESLRTILNVEFKDVSLLIEAITHASRPSYGVSCYQRLEFMGDAVLDHLITKHLFFSYTDLPPGRLTDLRAAAVNNENFARVAVKHKLHLHLRHGSSSLENQIHEFVKEFENHSTNLNINSFGLGDCKAPKVLGDIIESIAGALFIDSDFDTSTVWKVFRPLLEPIVTPDTLGIHPVRELQELCQHQAEGLEYKSTRSGHMATVEVYVDGVQIGVGQNRQKKMAQKLAARNALLLIKDKQVDEPEGRRKGKDDNKNNNGCQVFTRQTLNDLCLRRNWPMPLYRCVYEGGPAHARRFTYAVRVNTAEWGWTDECVGEPMPNVKKAKDSASLLLLDLIAQKKHVK